MNLPPYSNLAWAYQLHYYLCFRTHRRRQHFRSHYDLLKELLTEICERHDYHLLECQPQADQLRCLLSLRPEQSVTKTVQTLKVNSSRESARQLTLEGPVWARGYLARSVGLVRIDVVSEYLKQQPAHHGYDTRALPPVYEYSLSEPIPLVVARASFELDHHLVFATSQRKGVFGSRAGRALGEYWLKVAAKHGFAIDQVSIVPDHAHLRVRIVPKMSIEECALLLMNNGQYFIGKYFPQLLIESGLTQLWQPSAYAGTIGNYTSGLIQKWLSSADVSKDLNEPTHCRGWDFRVATR